MRSRRLVAIRRNLDLLASVVLLGCFYSVLLLTLPASIVMDTELLRTIVNYSNSTMDLTFEFINEMGSVPFWLLIAGFLWLRKQRRVATYLLVGIIADALLASLLKVVFARPRPYEAMPDIRTIDAEPSGSFPSGHTERSFTSAVILSRFYRRWTLGLFALGGLIAFARIYTGNHYPLDTVAGAVNGLVLGTVVVRIPIDSLERKLEIYWNRLTRRFKFIHDLENVAASLGH